MVAAHEIFSRIAPETFGYACTHLDGASVEQLAAMLDACVQEAAGCDAPLPSVEIAMAITRTTEATDVRYSLEEISSKPRSLKEQLRGLSESESEFNARQKRLHDAYEAFANQLTPQMAAVVLKTFRLEEVQSILRVSPGLAQRWIDLFRGATESGRRALRNFSIYLACALTHGEMLAKGGELLKLLQEEPSFVRVRYTLAGLSLEAVALWRAADGVEINRLRFARLGVPIASRLGRPI